MSLPFSPSADRNKEVIGNALERWLCKASTVFEFGSGTGQHAVYLSLRFPHLQWQPSELKANIETIRLLIQQAGVSNILAPIECDVLAQLIPGRDADASQVSSDNVLQYSFAYSANTAHIMSMPAVERMLSIAAALLQPAGYFALYGPFKYGSKHTAEGNSQFDAMLREQDAVMGVRDKFELDQIAVECGLTPVEDLAMPSNNRILMWQRVGEI